VNISHKQKSIDTHVDPPDWTFRETIFQSVGGAAPVKFLRVQVNMCVCYFVAGGSEFTNFLLNVRGVVVNHLLCRF